MDEKLCNLEETSDVLESESMRVPEKNYTDILKRVKRIEIINYISIAMIFILIIVSFTTILLLNNTSGVENPSTQVKLPKELNKHKANEIIDDIIEYFNNGEEQKLYNIMGDYTKTLLSFDEFQDTFSQMQILGKVESASYTHYEFIQHAKGGNWFTLFYVANYEKGKGNATVTIRVVDNEWEIIGFRFNIGQVTN